MPSDIELGSSNTALVNRMVPSGIRVVTSPTVLTPTEIESLNHPAHNDLQTMQAEENIAIRHLLESWMDRLQLISVLAIFFASLEATLLSITMPQDQGNPNLSIVSQAANVCLTSGLLLHILAAFVSFLGGFFLVRYRIKWAKVEQKTVLRTRKMQRSLGSFNGTDENLYQSPIVTERSESSIPVPMPMPMPALHTTGREHPPQASAQLNQAYRAGRGQGPRNRRSKSIWFLTDYYPTFLTSHNTPTADPDCPSMRHPLPTRLLSRFHFLCIILTLLGFLFSLAGIVLNAWERLPRIVGVVVTIITAITLLTILWMMFIPDRYPEHDSDISAS